MNNTATAVSCTSVTTHPTTSYSCQVTNIKPLTKNTFQVDLQSTTGEIAGYHAGQYLQLELNMNGNEQHPPLFYSIANSIHSAHPRHLQIFIQNSSKQAEKILMQLSHLSKSHENITVTLPMGQAFLQTDLSLHHLLIAAGSGISQIKCLTEEILKQQPNIHMDIYWSNKNTEDFYLFDHIQDWLHQHSNLNFTPILESAVESTHKNWHGRSGYIYEVIQEDVKNLEATQAYLCGSPQMVYGTIDKLRSIGLKEANCYSDVFEYSPRN
jgi:CDP-4-dehydro-6-deoxyglucose reductase